MIPDFFLLMVLGTYQKSNPYTFANFVIKDIPPFSPSSLATCTSISSKVKVINQRKILQEMFTHPIQRSAIKKAIVTDKTDYSITITKPICCPTEKPDVG